MKYVSLVPNSLIVAEVIPEENPLLPGIPIDQRYAKAFIDSLICVNDDVVVEQNNIYDMETGTFKPEEIPEPNSEVQDADI